MSLALRASDPDRRLILDEAEAWLDAGCADLCALVLGGVRTPDRTARAYDLDALVARRDLDAHGAAAVNRTSTGAGLDAADDFVMAARIATAAGRIDDAVRWLEAALVALPGHPIAASMLFAFALASRDPESIQRYLRVRLAGLDPTQSIDAMRSCALTLIETDHHRGFGRRLLRQTLERAYEAQHTHIPSHLAMWITLAARADDGAPCDRSSQP